MNMDLANVDVHLASHWRRVELAERFGPLLSPSSTSTTTHRISILALPVIGQLLRAVMKALCAIGNVAQDSREALRSNEQHLAALGITWTTDVAYDTTLAEELLVARQRRITARETAPSAPVFQAGVNGTAAGNPQRSNDKTVGRAGGRLRVSLPSTIAGGMGQSGD